MLRISKKLDYALIILADLASDKSGDVVSARAIAGKYGLPLPVTSGVLKTLASHGIVTSTRGSRGGHKLSVDPALLTLGRIAHVIEGPMQLADCIPHGGAHAAGEECEYESCCPVQKPVKEIHKTISEILSSISLLQLMGAEPLFWKSDNPFKRSARVEAVV